MVVLKRAEFWWRLGIVLAGWYGLTFRNHGLVYFTVQSNLIVFGYAWVFGQFGILAVEFAVLGAIPLSLRHLVQRRVGRSTEGPRT